MNRLALSALLALGFLVVPVMAQAQQVKVPRIGFLAGGSRAADALLLESFWRRMQQLGYTEGANVVAEYRFAEGSPERLAVFADELVRLKVNVIVGPGSGAVAAKKATSTIPIVLTYGDPVAIGLVTNLAHPGGNVTGLSGFASELGGKQLELLKEGFPKVSRVAVLWWEQNALLLDDIKAAADALGVTIQPVELRTAADLEPAFAAIKTQRADALIVVRNPLTVTQRVKIANFAASSRMPAMYGDREFTEAGGLMSYGVSIPEMWGRSAVYVDKILKGAPPRDLPIERPNRFELVINAKAAKAAGLTMPRSLLVRADEVLE